MVGEVSVREREKADVARGRGRENESQKTGASCVAMFCGHGE